MMTQRKHRTRPTSLSFSLSLLSNVRRRRVLTTTHVAYACSAAAEQQHHGRRRRRLAWLRGHDAAGRRHQRGGGEGLPRLRSCHRATRSLLNDASVEPPPPSSAGASRVAAESLDSASLICP